MSYDERRKNQRLDCRIGVQLRSGSLAARGVITNISDDGLFIELGSAMPQGMQTKIRFKHPDLDRTITTRAIVARTHHGATSGVGLYLPERLSAHASERRGRERSAVDFGVELRVGRRVGFCRAIDWSRTGAGLSLEADLRLVRALRPGTRVELRYKHPSSPAVQRREVIVARNARAGRAGAGCLLGVVFADSPGADLLLGNQLASSGAWSISEALDSEATVELSLRALLRSVAWRAGALRGAGRLALAGASNVLVASAGATPPEQERVAVTLRSGDTASDPSVDLEVKVTGSGPRQVAGTNPGFAAEIVGFGDAASESLYDQLVDWMLERRGQWLSRPRRR